MTETRETPEQQPYADAAREAVLAAARRQFRDLGFGRASVGPIAEEAGVTIEELSEAFGSKQALLLALVDSIRERTRAPELGVQMSRASDPREVVATAARIRRLILELCGDIVISFRDAAVWDPEIARAYGEGRRRSREGIGRMVSRVAELGGLRHGLSQANAIDAVSALFAAELWEELTGPWSGWSADEYEEWLAARIADAVLA